MENLKNTEILIGKEPGNGRLLIALNKNGQNKVAPLGTIGSVPNCVSRCRPGEGIAHCKISINAEGAMTLVNLKPQNITYVNGSEILSKRIDENSRISLGKDMYPIDIKAILKSAEVLSKQVIKGQKGDGNAVKEFSIRPLNAVWDTYHQQMIDIQKKGKKRGDQRLILTLISSLGAVGGMAARSVGGNVTVISNIAICVSLLFVFYLIVTNKRDKSIEIKEKLTDKFQDDYVCPNPECGHFMGNQPYKLLRQNKVCPYCRCKLNEN